MACKDHSPDDSCERPAGVRFRAFASVGLRRERSHRTVTDASRAAHAFAIRRQCGRGTVAGDPTPRRS